jgi:hypothetical protein
MSCVFFFSDTNREKILQVLDNKNLDISYFFVEMTDSDLFLPYSPFNFSEYRYVVTFPKSWIPTKKNLNFCISLCEIAELETFDLIQFSYRTRFFKRRYERAPIYLFLRLTIMSAIRLNQRNSLMFRSFLRLDADKESRFSRKPGNLRLRLFPGYFFDDTKGYIASSRLINGLESLKFGSLSGQRALMALARDSRFKVCSMYPQKVPRS